MRWITGETFYISGGFLGDARVAQLVLDMGQSPLSETKRVTLPDFARQIISQSFRQFFSWSSASMRFLIVHAHHEPQSFCSALFRQAKQTLRATGHDVITSDLYADRFDPVSDRRNFTSVLDPSYLKQQAEERHASTANGFAPELEREIQKLEQCDRLIFTFPIWWFGMPAILKGWVDRVFAMRRIYGDGRLYENGLGRACRRAMVIMTIGGGPEAYGGDGVNPSLETILTPIQHGVFWFNGFLPLDPFVAWRPARIPAEQRAEYLRRLDQRLRNIDSESPWRLPPLCDFPGFARDQKRRFMVQLAPRRKDEASQPRLSDDDHAALAGLKRSGIVLSAHFSSPDTTPWRCFLHCRASDDAELRLFLEALPFVKVSCDVEVSELAPPAGFAEDE